MTTALPAEPRSEALLWIQLLGLGALPLEALLLLLLLAGTDPGPWPWLERGLVWALGALAPGLLLWKRPVDVFSLLLLSTPLRGRRELQRRLSNLQQGLGLQLALALGAASLLPLLAWLDRWSVLARDWAPLPEAPRLVALLLSAALLALMLWQWQQLLQALWLLLRPAKAVAAAAALTAEEISSRRLCLGLPLLLPNPLRFEAVEKPQRRTAGRASERPRGMGLEAEPQQEPQPQAAQVIESVTEQGPTNRPTASASAAADDHQAIRDAEGNASATPPDDNRPGSTDQGGSPAEAPSAELAPDLVAEQGHSDAEAALAAPADAEAAREDGSRPASVTPTAESGEAGD